MRLIIYTGKGGTGKTVTSCSTAVKLADNKHKTLLLSSDPAHTLSDALDIIKIGNDPTKVLDNLDALQIDPVIEMAKHFKPILSYMVSVYFSKGVDEMLSHEIAMLPGMTQLFSLLKIEESIRESRYDAIVLDMPASGEALRYLYFPKIAGSIGRKFEGFSGIFSNMAKMIQPFSVFQKLPPSNVIKNELDLLSKLESLSILFTDPKITSIRLVANPDTFSIENAKRALMSANLFGINVDLLIINKIMPTGSSDTYFAKWGEFQKNKVDEAKLNFYPLPTKEISLYETELKGIEMLRNNSNLIFENEDPAKVFYLGKIFEFNNIGTKLQMIIKIPFTKKDDHEIDYYGDQVVIKVKSPTGYLVNVIPLPSATIGMRIIEAKLADYKLNILFEK